MLSGYLTSMPNDPLQTSSVTLDVSTATTGYGYISIVRAGVNHNGSVLLAQTEGDGASSNMAATGMTSTTDASVIDSLVAGCGGKVAKTTSTYSWTSNACSAPAAGLRYYYVQ